MLRSLYMYEIISMKVKLLYPLLISLINLEQTRSLNRFSENAKGKYTQ